MEASVQISPSRLELSASKRELLEKRLRGALKGTTPASAIPKRPDDGPAPLSFIQQQLWFLHQLNPSSPAYNIAVALRITGLLKAEALEEALNRLLERQQALRTHFSSAENGPMQIVAPFQFRPLPVVDLQEFSQTERKLHAEQFMRREAQRPFDLAQGPLFRFTLIRLSASEHVLLLVMHHTISDGWSLGVIFRELEGLYKAALQRTDPELPDLPVQLTDYAAWQHDGVAQNAFAADLDFWKEKLAGAPFAIDLPLDHLRKAHPGFKGAYCSLTLPRTFTDAMLALSHVHGATSFMLLMAGLNILLNQWTAQSDLVVGTVVACRTRREIENLVGCFMNFLPLRTSLAGLQTGADLLREIKATVLEGYVHQDCPFEKIVETLNPSRNLAANPLYNVALLLQNYPVGVLSSCGLSSDFTTIPTQSSLLDLRFIAEEKEQGIVITCEYDTDLFERSTVENLLASYRHVLEQLVRNPEKPLAEFRLLPELASQAAAVRKRRSRQTVAISGTFTVEPIEESLNYWMKALDLPAAPVFAPYNQLFQQLLDPLSPLRTNNRGINVLLIRLEDLRPAPGSSLEDVANEFLRALKGAVSQSAVPYMICICPPSKSALSDPKNCESFARIEKEILNEIAALPNAYAASGSEILDLYPVTDYDDPHSDRLGHVPYSQTFFHALGTFVARKFHALLRPPRKVVVLDCDQTLWSGICGEDGVSGIKCDPARKALQEFMRAQHDAGMLLCLCSKNNETDVWDVFTSCSDMVLRKEHFAAWRINWDPKSANLRALAAELRVGLDTFIFIDDNPVECAEVEANCAEVLTLQVPVDTSSIPHWLKHLWVFDRLKVTAEDRNRAAMYQQNRMRDQLMAESMNMADFLAGLNLQITIEPAREDQLPRLAQLTQRTNQFNCTTRRRTEADMTNLWRAGLQKVLAVSVSDRFGDYGLVGLMIYETAASVLKVDTFLLSCRVLGKGVEHRMLAALGEMALSAGLRRVDVRFSATAKNKPALDFLNSVGASFRQGNNGTLDFQFPADVAAQIVFDPQSAQSPVAPADTVPSANSSVPEELPGANFRRFNWIAMSASDASQVAALIAAQGVRGPVPIFPRSRQPQSELEGNLLTVWRELLHSDEIGVEDDFFAMGGSSLLAVRLCAQIEKNLGHKVALATLFRAPTVEQLARAIERSHSRSGRSSLVAIQPKGSRPPLVLIHGAGGGILWGYANLAAHLGNDQPLYAIEPRHNKSGAPPTVEEMAAQYVKQLRAFQSKGPYALGGYCFGGYVAYEMARLLDSEGEPISLLVLIDSPAPNGAYERITWWRPTYYPRFAINSYYWLSDFFALNDTERRDFIQRKWAVAKRRLSHVLKSAPSTQPRVVLEEYIDISQFPQHELELWKLHLDAGSRYVPKPYNGKVWLLRTRGQPFFCSLDPKYGWGELARGGVEVRVLSGAHEKIFIEPDIQSLARELRTALDNTQSQSGGVKL